MRKRLTQHSFRKAFQRYYPGGMAFGTEFSEMQDIILKAGFDPITHAVISYSTNLDLQVFWKVLFGIDGPFVAPTLKENFQLKRFEQLHMPADSQHPTCGEEHAEERATGRQQLNWNIQDIVWNRRCYRPRSSGKYSNVTRHHPHNRRVRTGRSQATRAERSCGFSNHVWS